MEVKPVRKRNRLEQFDYSSGGAYFITICTKDRKCILGEIVGTTIVSSVTSSTPV